MTIQKLCDELILLCHEGHAQAEVFLFDNEKLKAVNSVTLCGEDFKTAIIETEKK